MAARPAITAMKLRPLTRKQTVTPATPITSPATAGPTMRAALNIAELRATALATSSRPTISMTKACRVGMSTAFDEAEADREDEDVPDLDDAGPGQAGQDQREDHQNGLGPDDRRPLRQHVGDDAADEAEHEDRRELDRGDHTEPERIVGQQQHQPRLRDGLHPGADERDHLAEPEEPEVAMAERAAPAELAGSESVTSGSGLVVHRSIADVHGRTVVTEPS